MKYALAEIELTDLASVPISAEQRGAGVLVRYREAPAAFVFVEKPSGLIAGEDLLRMLMTEAGTDIAHALARQELAPIAVDAPSPTVTVAVCTRDHPEITARAISSLLAAASYAGSDVLDILVVDNAPSDHRTRTVAESFPTVRYVCEAKPGLDFARNRAIEEARGELLAYIDDDAVVDRYWLEGLTNAFRQNPDAGAFTGPVLPFELETTAQILFEQSGGFGRHFTWRRYGLESAQDRGYPMNSGILGTGCNMVFRHALLVELGGFDEALDTGSPLPGGGDLDMLYRVVRSGAPLIYEPRLVVLHQHRRDYAALRHQMYTWGLGTMAYAVKQYGADPAQRQAFRYFIVGYWCALVVSLIRHLIKGRGRRAELGLAELFGALVGLCGEYGRSQRRIRRIRAAHSTSGAGLPDGPKARR